MTIDDRDLTPRPLETGLTASRATRALADELRDGTAYALAFGGQGIEWRNALSDLIDGTGIGPELQALVDASVAVTEPVHDEIAVVRTHGFRPIEWANRVIVIRSRLVAGCPAHPDRRTARAHRRGL